MGDRGGDAWGKPQFAQHPRGLRAAGDQADAAERGGEGGTAAGALGNAEEAPEAFAGEPDRVVEAAGDERVDPRLGLG